MFIRCVSCRSAVKIEALPSGENERLRCKSCRNELNLKPAAFKGLEMDEVQEVAIRLAAQNDFDLPSAVAVVLGAASLSQMKEWRHAVNAAVSSLNSPDASRSNSSSLVTESAEKSSKASSGRTEAEDERRVAKLVDQHGFPRSLARRVVSGNLTLREALRKDAGPRSEKTDEPAANPLGKKQTAIVCTVVAVIVVLIGLQSRSRWNERVRESQRMQETVAALRQPPAAKAPASRPAVPPAATSASPETMPGIEILRADDGRRTKISGPNPKAVLAAWCRSAESRNRCEPVSVISLPTPSAGSRIGLFQLSSRPGSLMAIRMRRDRRSRRWYVGPGVEAIEDSPAWYISEDGVAAMQQNREALRRKAVPEPPRRGYSFTG